LFLVPRNTTAAPPIDYRIFTLLACRPCPTYYYHLTHAARHLPPFAARIGFDSTKKTAYCMILSQSCSCRRN